MPRKKRAVFKNVTVKIPLYRFCVSPLIRLASLSTFPPGEGFCCSSEFALTFPVLIPQLPYPGKDQQYPESSSQPFLRKMFLEQGSTPRAQPAGGNGGQKLFPGDILSAQKGRNGRPRQKEQQIHGPGLILGPARGPVSQSISRLPPPTPSPERKPRRVLTAMAATLCTDFECLPRE